MTWLFTFVYNAFIAFIISKFFHSKSKWLCLIETLILSFVCFSTLFIFEHMLLKQIVFICTLILSISYLYTHNVKEIMICVIIVYLSQSIMEAIVSQISAIVIGRVSFLQFTILQTIVSNCIMCPLFYIIAKTLIKLYEKHKQIHKSNVIFMFLLSTQLMILLALIQTAYLHNKITFIELYYILSVIILLFICFFCFQIFKTSRSVKHLYFHNTLAQQKIDIEHKNYFDIYHQQEVTLELYQEIVDHINEMMNLLKIDDNMVHTYITALYGKYEKLQSHYYTNHSILNAILIHYYQLCSIKYIEYKVDIQIQEDQVLIEDVHLSIILNNLLENAVRYSGKQGSIYVVIKMVFNQLFIQVKNKIVEKEESQKKIHGYGMVIIKDILPLYSGTIEVITEKDTFHVLIMMVNDRVNS